MDLCFISSNIRFDNPNDHENAWGHRREFLAKTLLKHSPALIGTQEGREPQLRDFHTLLPDFEMATGHRKWIAERMYPTIYFNPQKLSLKASGDSWLSETPSIPGSKSFGSQFPRLMTWGKFEIKNSHRQILLINTHLDHIEETTRVEQAKVLVQEAKNLLTEGMSLIVQGDFNTTPDSEVRKIIINAFPDLVDSWRIFNPVEEASYHSFKGEYDHSMRIDWILVEKNLVVEASFMDRRMTEGDRFPSDHFPVITKFKV